VAAYVNTWKGLRNSITGAFGNSFWQFIGKLIRQASGRTKILTQYASICKEISFERYEVLRRRNVRDNREADVRKFGCSEIFVKLADLSRDHSIFARNLFPGK
jgi:hypothetical protein